MQIFWKNRKKHCFSQEKGYILKVFVVDLAREREGNVMGTDMDTISWENRYILGIPLIDKQHEQIVNITNELSAGLVDLSNVNFSEKTMDAISYIHYHFSTEEKLMVLLDFSGYHHHKREHENFINEIFKYAEQYKSGKKDAPNRLVYYLKEWIFSHIIVSDRVFTNFIQEKRRNGDLRQMLLLTPQSVPLSA